MEMAIRLKLREILDTRGMLQTELQALRGLGYSSINAMYNGKTERISFGTLDTLCRTLRCEVGDILEYEPESRRSRR